MSNIRTKFALICLISLGLFLIFTGYTDADLFAERNVARNILRAITRNIFALTTTNSSPLDQGFLVTGILPNGFDAKTFRIKKDEQDRLQYAIKAIKTNGDENLWNELTVDVLDGSLNKKYSGKLSQMSISSVITSNEPDDWIAIMRFDKSDANLKNKLCEFDITIRTWKVNVDDEPKGIYAQRKLRNSVSTGNW